jgi:hypothetical protein
MNEPHDNRDRDPFADDAQRRPSRLRRPVARDARRTERARCRTTAAGSASTIDAPAAKPLRHQRPCPHAARRPLR